MLCLRPMSAAPPLSVEEPPPEWRLSLTGVGTARQERLFRAEANGVTVDGRIIFDPADRSLHVEGVYRTNQDIYARAKLSYHILDEAGRTLRFEGERFDWQESGAGGREARFGIVQSLAEVHGLRPKVRVQFNYVVEHEYWYSDRNPEVYLPQLVVRAPARRALFAVRRAWVPPVLPANTAGVIPAWVRAEFGGEPPPYVAALDVLTADGSARIEAPRQTLPLWLAPGGAGMVVYRFGEVSGRSVQLRPGFVWEGVRWFEAYRANPYRAVRVVGPLEYVLGLTVAVLGLAAGARVLRRSRSRGLSWAGYVVWGALALGLALAVAVSLYVVIAVGLVLLWWLQRRIGPAGPRAYWTLWIFVVLLDLYWGHVNAGGGALWSGTLLSACLAALILLPLRLLQRPMLAAGVATGGAALTTLVAMVMAVYFSFFGDYPGLRDLLYVRQLGAVGDSVAMLMEQRHLVPWWLCACATIGLWRRQHGGIGGAVT